MYCSENYCTGSASCENAEVFRKEELEPRAMDEKRGKQKRRDRVSKHSSSKSKHGKTGGDVLAQIKAKENIVAPSNGAQRITISRETVPALFAQKFGIYNKGKSSILVSRRRPLHDIQPSQRTIQETEKDLKRVLGYSGSEKSPGLKCSSRSAGRRSSPMLTGGGGQPVEEPKQSSSEMEMSPPPDQQTATASDGDSILSIARRIADGLHPCMVYSDSDYLNNTKSELRKLLKQSNSSSVQPDMDTLVAGGIQQEAEHSPTSGVFLLPSSSSSAGATSYDALFSVPLFDAQSGSETTCDDCDFRLDMLRSAIYEPTSDQPFAMTEVELTTSTFDPAYPLPSDSADDGSAAVFQMEPPPPGAGEPPRDFLDLLDTMQQGSGGPCDHPDTLSRPPGSKWMPTPERPPMFPQKLY